MNKETNKQKDLPGFYHSHSFHEMLDLSGIKLWDFLDQCLKPKRNNITNKRRLKARVEHKSTLYTMNSFLYTCNITKLATFN